jgi:hypothetical protein
MISNTAHSDPSDKVIVGECRRQSNRLACESQFLDDTFDAMTIVSSLSQKRNTQKMQKIAAHACVRCQPIHCPKPPNPELKSNQKTAKNHYRYIRSQKIIDYSIIIIDYYIIFDSDVGRLLSVGGCCRVG